MSDAHQEHEQQRILITQARAGMVLSQPVFTPTRVPLCGAGTSLNDELIHRLTMRGVKRIHVRGCPLHSQNELPFEERMRLLEERFSRIEGYQPLMTGLMETIRAEMAKTS